MVYNMDIYVYGGCRRIGQPDAVGAAAALRLPNGTIRKWTENLPRTPPITNDRAEQTALILAFEFAIKRYGE